MKKLLWVIASLFSMLWVIVLALLISADLQILEPEEQEKLKSGKLFWEWTTPHGSLMTHYVEKGEGSNHLIFLHGFRAHSYTWRYLMEPLAQAGYHVWALDLIGYGLSDKPDNISYSIDLFIQQIEDFMIAKGISKAHFVGNSLGGGLALQLAISHSHRIASLSLLNALGYPLDMPFYIAISRHISQIWTPFLGPTMIRCCLKRIVYNQEVVSDEQVEAYCLPYRFPGGITSTLLTLRQFDKQYLINMSKQYPSLPHPILVIWGDHDSLIPVDHYEKFLKDFPNAHRLLISNCGHIPQEEQPEEVLNAMLNFLGTIKEASSALTTQNDRNTISEK